MLELILIVADVNFPKCNTIICNTCTLLVVKSKQGKQSTHPQHVGYPCRCPHIVKQLRYVSCTLLLSSQPSGN